MRRAPEPGDGDTSEDRYPPIGDYALLSDCHSAALVSTSASVDWSSMHRFDARSVFGRILDWERGGHFQVAPNGPASSSRRYLPGTNVLETTFQTPSGQLELTDALLVAPAPDPASGSRVHPYHQLVRRLRCTSGEVEAEVVFEPRFEYGLTIPRLELISDDLATVFGGADALTLQSDVPLTWSDGSRCRGGARLTAGDEAWLVVTYDDAHLLEPRRYRRAELADRLAATVSFWQAWSDRCSYDGPYRELVQRSALVLKGLQNSPTGAIAAAPTTSLPEGVGGVRNWDYRYTWIRDGVLTLLALFDLHYDEEADVFMRWLQRTTAGRAEDLQIMYGLGGERLLPEVELHQLDGYRGSRPVRIGNEAAEQFQLDVYGELLDTAWIYHRRGGDVDAAFWEFLRDVVELVTDRWQQPDRGIWEVRGDPRWFVSSQVMAWVAVDRGIRLVEDTGFAADVDRWRQVRDDIEARVLADGVDDQTGAFTRAFGERSMDASNLLLPLVGFVPGDDPRMVATVQRIEEELGVDGLLYRYRDDDGLPGGEGAWFICSFWLVDALIMSGRLDRARQLFERLIGFANDVGLLSEQVDPHTGQLLGNYPQAFSHIGLIRAATHLQRAEQKRSGAADR
jgi:GH15 family glucan-1,4-alpha-glucosidase